MELDKVASSKINSSSQKDRSSFFSFGKDEISYPPFFQPKLTINQPNDPFEQEADAMADKVMRMTAPVIQTKCSGCEEEEEKKVQLKESPDLQKQDVPDTDSLVPADPVTPASSIQLPLPSLLLPSTEPDFLAMRQPFFQRNIAHLWDADSALQVWHYNFDFFRRFGLSPDLSASASNFTAPFSIDSQLKAGNPTWWEITDRDLGTSSFTAALPVLDFNADFSPAAPSWFKTIFGGGGNNRVQRKCDECEDEEKKLQLKETGGGQNADSKLTDYIGNLNVSGEQLPGEVRSFYEPRFGHDFSAVKIHTGSAAAKSAQSINALAYTTGSNIVFNNGQYAPDTDSGKRLLGHELTHVVQQNNGINMQVQKLGANTNCSPAETDTIHQAIYNARGWVNNALAKMRDTPTSATVISSLRKNFGPTYGVVANLQMIIDRISIVYRQMGTIPYICLGGTNADALCDTAPVPCGWSVAGSNAVTVCRSSTLASGNLIYQAGCVLHEAFHATFSRFTVDEYSGWHGNSGSSATYPGTGTDPLLNADSYTSMIIDLS